MTDLLQDRAQGTPSESEADEREHDNLDPFRYGYRYVFSVVDGKEEWEQVPLTLDDVLHPQMEDFRMHSDMHYRLCHYLYTVLRAYLERDPGNLVLHDVLIEWDVPNMRGHGPDIVVFADVREKPDWGSFNQAEAGGRPLLIIEVTSPGTRRLDVAPANNDPDPKTKFLHYAIVGVPLYIIVDLAKRKKGQAPSILGYQLTDAGYTPLPLNAQGWLWVEPAGLWLGPSMQKVAWYTASGQKIGDYEDEQAARIAAEQQATQERARAEQERARAEQERARAEQERARAAQLEDELRRLRGEA